ncbi:hypothetical protein EW026_g5536 [Hermanssonia centrifuga]|uniref:G domain-containing protein n=1 Tax=Hermanssonia centrifuga TaxID=98765 RepID=A0A4S4KDT4_9APHY|nr:hypothetical protein EW026_g5536 [Hermanssonia centrifuga]
MDIKISSNGKQLENVWIAVMGPTGAGKSTFINTASNSDLRVGETLQSCTDKIEFSKSFELEGRMVTLVDTPGFDDTAKSDTEVLNIVCDYFSTEYANGRLLHGIIYMYRISDNRVSGTAARNLQFYQQLCGPEALSNSVIVTNMWGLVDPKVGANREQELKSKGNFFKPALDYGAKCLRHDNTTESAHNIIRAMIHNNIPKPFLIQRELIDEKKKVFQTAAGEALLRELAKLEQKHLQEMQELDTEMADALARQDEDAKQELEELRAQLLAETERLNAEKKRLHELKLTTAPGTTTTTTQDARGLGDAPVPGAWTEHNTGEDPESGRKDQPSFWTRFKRGRP